MKVKYRVEVCNEKGEMIAALIIPNAGNALFQGDRAVLIEAINSLPKIQDSE
jgi:hypothetical protein